MHALETSLGFNLSDTSVWLLGDVHGNTGWLQRVLPAMKRFDPTVKTILQLGDWWQDTRPVDHWANVVGIERVLVTLGNHEPYGQLTPMLDAHSGAAVRVSQVVWILPRPFRFNIGGRAVLSVGGASSADAALRTEGLDWWSDEAITDSQVLAAGAGGAVDLLLTHESPEETPVAAALRVIADHRREAPANVALLTEASRRKVDQVVDAVRPRLHVHGHLHISGQGKTSDRRRVVSLGRDLDPGAVAKLDLSSLEVSFMQEGDIWHRRR